MSSVNKIFVLGRLGSAPTLRQAGETQVASFRVATEERWAANIQTEWHTVEAWGALGERCAQYLVQGQQVHVEGQLRSDDVGAGRSQDAELENRREGCPLSR